ncbi:hypothetical protein [Paenibacillus mesophilus]|uniref:hypothetical protein n=1 Tax=Paenibacillus mesophilus TaxID=2582849 RepID=UPI001EE3BE9A|nr:hypothetical protein [Paenibacillus mesophilus]
MTQKRKVLLTGLIGITMAAGIFVGQAVIESKADGAVQPGSADDPLVTKSYLDEQLKKVTGGQWTGSGNTGTGQPSSTVQGISEQRVNEIIAAEIAKVKQELQAQIPPIGGTQTQPQQPTTPTTGAASNLEVIKLEAGQVLYGGIGAEIIVRSGKTIAVSNSDGIPDVTAGKDISAGSAIENNHLLIIPREGRGIKPDPKQKGDIYVMVRGSYILLKEDGTKTAP